MDNAKIKINMTDRRPVVINTEDWPIVSEGYATWHDGQIESQANRTFMARIVVRRHSDGGRTIVYGKVDFESNLQNERDATFHAGYLLDAGNDPVTAIKRVANDLICNCEEKHLHNILDITIIDEAESDCLNGLEPECL